MAINFRKLQYGINIVPRVDGSTAPTSQGDLAVSSVDGNLYYNNGSVVTALVGQTTSSYIQNKTLDASTVFFVDPSDNTKVIKFSDSGATTGTSLTLAGIQTANRVITFPDVTGTVLVGSTPGVIANNVLDEASVWFVDTSDHTKALKFDSSGSTTATSTTIVNSQTVNRVITLPNATDTLVGRATTDTLTNKTLSGNTATNLVNGAGVFNINSTGTITVPNATDTLVGKATTDTLSNKTLDNTTIETIKDANFTIQDDADTTKQAKFQASGISTATTRTFTFPDANTILVGTDATQTLTNKTLSGNTATNLVNGAGTFNFNSSGTITAPNVTDTLAGLAATQTFTNKTFGDAITCTQISTPSNPSAGFDKMYFKTDNKLYALNSAGSEQLIGPTSTSGINNYFTGAFQVGNTWQVLSGSAADFSLVTGTPTLTTRYSSGLTVVVSPSAYPGVSWSPSSNSAAYLVTFSFCVNRNSADWGYAGIWDGTNVVGSTTWIEGNTGNFGWVSITGIYLPGTTSPVDLRLQGAVRGAGALTVGTTAANGISFAYNVEISITQIIG